MTRARVRTDADSAPFWAACDSERLVGQRCGACGQWRWPPREHCPDCRAAAPEWVPLDGGGTVLAHVRLDRAPVPGFALPLPLSIVHVALDGTDGRMVLQANPVVEPADDRAVVGARATVRFIEGAGGQRLPAFVLDDQQGERHD